MIFKYHPDNLVIIDFKAMPVEAFLKLYPDFPIKEQPYFEYHKNGMLEIIRQHDDGTWTGYKVADIREYLPLLKLIHDLEIILPKS